MNSTTQFFEVLKPGGLVLAGAFSLWVAGIWLHSVQGEDAIRTGNEWPQGAADSGVKQAGSANGTESQVLARVNGDMVTRDELHRVQVDLLALSRQQREPGDEAPGGEELERLALRKLIQRHLILQEAGRQRIAVTEQELDQAISALRNRFADLEAFGHWMQERGLDDRSLFDTVRDDLLVARVMATLVDGVEVTEQQVQDYYASHKNDLILGEEVRLRIIVVESRAAAQEILDALREGENFSRLARERSLGLRAAQGGDMGWVNSRALPPMLRSSVALLQPGDASHPLQKDTEEFLIVGLQGRRPARAETLDEARPVIERRLLAARQQEAVQGWLRDQEKRSNIEVIPKPNESQTGSGMVTRVYAETRF